MFDHWKDGEYNWCAALVRGRGHKFVGYLPAAIAGYLEVQAASARHDGEGMIGVKLAAAAVHVRAADFANAEKVLSRP